MKHTTIILFLCCCLVVTTFADYNHKGPRDSKERRHSGWRNHSGGGSNESGGDSKESGGGSNECLGDSDDSGGGKSVSLKFGCSSTYYYTYNEESQTVIYNDYENKLSVLYAGQTGEAYVFSLEDGGGVYIRGGLTDKTWYHKKQQFDDYFKQVYSTKKLYELGLKYGYQFDGDTVTYKTLVGLKRLLITQSSDYKYTYNAFNYAMVTSRQAAQYPVKGAKDYFGSLQNIQLKGDAYWIRGYFQGWKSFVRDFDGELEVFKKEDVKLDMKKLLELESGDEIYIEILRAIHSKSKLVEVVGKRSNNQVGFFESIGGFCGRGPSGYRGFLVVVEAYVKYANGDISYSNLEYVVWEHLISKSGVEINYQEKWETTIKTLVEVIKVELKLEKEFGGILEILEKIQKKQWSLNGVNLYEGISEICKEKRPSNKESIRKILGKLKKRGGKDSSDCNCH